MTNDELRAKALELITSYKDADEYEYTARYLVEYIDMADNEDDVKIAATAIYMFIVEGVRP